MPARSGQLGWEAANELDAPGIRTGGYRIGQTNPLAAESQYLEIPLGAESDGEIPLPPSIIILPGRAAVDKGRRRRIQ